MGLWGEDVTTSQNYVDCTQDLFNESIAREIQAQNCTDIPVSSITCIAAAPDVQKMPPDTIPHPIMADNGKCKLGTLCERYPRLIGGYQIDRIDDAKAAIRRAYSSSRSSFSRLMSASNLSCVWFGLLGVEWLGSFKPSDA
ncbi:hypothetical protein V2G26_019086 [Clonostachys chloroleuca]